MAGRRLATQNRTLIEHEVARNMSWIGRGQQAVLIISCSTRWCAHLLVLPFRTPLTIAVVLMVGMGLPHYGHAAPATVHIRHTQSFIDPWSSYLRAQLLQIGCFKRRGMDPEAIPANELATVEQIRKSTTQQVEEFFSGDLYRREAVEQVAEMNDDTCQYETSPRKVLYLREGCQQTIVHYGARSISISGSQECDLSSTAMIYTELARLRVLRSLMHDGETHVVAGAQCQFEFRSDSPRNKIGRSCLLSDMPFSRHTIAGFVVLVREPSDVAVRAEQQHRRVLNLLTESEKRAAYESLRAEERRQHDLGQDLHLGGFTLQATLVEIDQPVPVEYFQIPADAQGFEVRAED
jgi:hypothetical protein